MKIYVYCPSCGNYNWVQLTGFIAYCDSCGDELSPWAAIGALADKIQELENK